MSGHPNPAVNALAKTRQDLRFYKSIFELVSLHCKDTYKQKVTIEPVELRVTDLKFAPVNTEWKNRIVGGRVVGADTVLKPGERPILGGISTGPRADSDVKVPVLTGDKFVEESTAMKKDKKEVYPPIAHFLIGGYWIYKITAGEKTEYIAVWLDYNVRTLQHVPYDKAFADAFATVKKKYEEDKKATIGMPFSQLNRAFTTERDVKKYKKEIIEVYSYIKPKAGDKLTDYGDIKIIPVEQLYQQYGNKP